MSKSSTLKLSASAYFRANYQIGFILLLAAVLRLIHPFDIPFTYDELSALYRTHYSNISDEITFGVMRYDTHPAGVQVFLYYWTKLFGYAEFAVKIPFIIFGILSVYYIFRLGKEWFNSTVGLVCAAYLATLQYPIMYSQLARPYISGLFLSLVMVWHWNKVVSGQWSVVSGQSSPANEQPQPSTANYYKHFALYILFSALCAYNHHFSLLFAAIVGFTGLFFVRGKQLMLYVFAGISIFIFYIPHLHIFFYQLKEGGVGAWLGKPHKTFIIDYIKYILEFSKKVYLLAAILVLFSVFYRVKNYQIIKLSTLKLSASAYFRANYQIIAFAWFLVPFLIGFFYSRYVNAVLQYSVLIFSFPFLLFAAFGLLPDLEKSNFKIPLALLILLVCTVNVLGLVQSRKYYKIFYHSTYQRQVLLNDSMFKAAGLNNFTALAVASPDSSINLFYFQKYHIKLPYTYIPDSGDLYPLVQYLEQHKRRYVTYNNLGSADLRFLPVILNYYPYVVLENDLSGGTNYIFSSKPGAGKSPYIFQSVNEFDKPAENWDETDKRNLAEMQNFTSLQHGDTVYKMDSLHEWAPAFSCPLAQITDSRYNYILVSLSLYPLGTMKDVEIVSTLESHNKEIFWGATPVSDFIPDTTRKIWMSAYHTLKLPDMNLNYPDIKVKIFIWNRGKRNFYMDDFAVRTMKGNTIIYWSVENK